MTEKILYFFKFLNEGSRIDLEKEKKSGTCVNIFDQVGSKFNIYTYLRNLKILYIIIRIIEQVCASKDWFWEIQLPYQF